MAAARGGRRARPRLCGIKSSILCNNAWGNEIVLWGASREPAPVCGGVAVEYTVLYSTAPPHYNLFYCPRLCGSVGLGGAVEYRCDALRCGMVWKEQRIAEHSMAQRAPHRARGKGQG